jgi:Subtilase family
VSPHKVIPVENGALSPIAERVLNCASLSHDFRHDGIVIARDAELIVYAPALSAPARRALRQVADRIGNLATIRRPATKLVASRRQAGRQLVRDEPPKQNGRLSEVEIWRLKDPATRSSIDEARRLRELAGEVPVKTLSGHDLVLPVISPHHASILAPAGGGCPAGPPTPALEPDEVFVPPPAEEPTAKVTILDSGYMWVDQPDLEHRNLDARVTVVHGQWLNTQTRRWLPDKPDGLYTNPFGQLDGISGHGTFIAGLITHLAPQTRLEVVGLRNEEVEIGVLNRVEQLGLYETEVAIAHAMLRRCNTDVMQCGFAFPTLDDYPSLPFWAAMEEIREKRGDSTAVVAPAGNEQSRRRCWPAALPDVIGVASTNRRGNARAWFSNWGGWCDCCTRGEYVYSTFIDWNGPIEGDLPAEIEHFRGWARWDGTSFAAPKVSAEIARLFVKGNRATPPVQVGADLIAGKTDVAVWNLTDATLSGPPGVDLPYLQI